MRLRASSAALALLLAAVPASALPDGGADDAASPEAGSLDAGSLEAGSLGAGSLEAGAAEPPRVWASCLEHVPPGATRPKLVETFPARGTSGYALPLEVTVEHGKGETVLPQGFRMQTGSDAARAIAEAGFVLPDPDGGAGPSKATTLDGARAKTTVVVPFVALPKTPGRHELTLPPVPIAVARASGELVTVCTEPHAITVEDPTASTPDAKPKPNPAARSQIEEWTLAKEVAIGTVAGAIAALAAAWLIARWRRRPRPVPPPPPPRPPWEVAFEELLGIRRAALPAQGKLAEHFDGVSDAVRKYLGGRYGFDGLETTTDEMTAFLKRVSPAVLELGAILAFLGECDLVKFARLAPSVEDCERILALGEHIVRVTMPVAAPAPAAAPQAGGGAAA